MSINHNLRMSHCIFRSKRLNRAFFYLLLLSRCVHDSNFVESFHVPTSQFKRKEQKCYHQNYRSSTSKTNDEKSTNVDACRCRSSKLFFYGKKNNANASSNNKHQKVTKMRVVLNKIFPLALSQRLFSVFSAKSPTFLPYSKHQQQKWKQTIQTRCLGVLNAILSLSAQTDTEKETPTYSVCPHCGEGLTYSCSKDSNDMRSEVQKEEKCCLSEVDNTLSNGDSTVIGLTAQNYYNGKNSDRVQRMSPSAYELLTRFRSGRATKQEVEAFYYAAIQSGSTVRTRQAAIVSDPDPENVIRITSNKTAVSTSNEKIPIKTRHTNLRPDKEVQFVGKMKIETTMRTVGIPATTEVKWEDKECNENPTCLDKKIKIVGKGKIETKVHPVVIPVVRTEVAKNVVTEGKKDVKEPLVVLKIKAKNAKSHNHDLDRNNRTDYTIRTVSTAVSSTRIPNPDQKADADFGSSTKKNVYLTSRITNRLRQEILEEQNRQSLSAVLDNRRHSNSE